MGSILNKYVAASGKVAASVSERDLLCMAVKAIMTPSVTAYGEKKAAAICKHVESYLRLLQNDDIYLICHSRENGNPVKANTYGFRIKCGMTLNAILQNSIESYLRRDGIIDDPAQ